MELNDEYDTDEEEEEEILEEQEEEQKDGEKKKEKVLKWVPMETKFMDIYSTDQFKCTTLKEDWRPIQAESINAKKIIFILDDEHVCYDIQGDS